jgi:hypothetical protein
MVVGAADTAYGAIALGGAGGPVMDAPEAFGIAVPAGGVWAREEPVGAAPASGCEPGFASQHTCRGRESGGSG